MVNDIQKPMITKPRFSFLDIGIFCLVFGALFGFFTHRHNMNFERNLMTATFINPMKEVEVAQNKPVPDDQAYKQKYDFTTDWFSSNIPVWEKVLEPFKGKPDLNYLEIGAYEGRSAVWMLEHILTDPKSRATIVDIFAGPYEDKYRKNIKLSGAEGKVTTIKASSQVALRGLPLDSFDIIYIDGSHAKDDVLEDATLSFRLLKKGGLLIFDDYRWAGFFASGTSDKPEDLPKIAVDGFYACFDKHFDVIHNSYQLIFRKK